MSGRGSRNTRSSTTTKKRAVSQLEDFNSRSTNEKAIVGTKRKCRLDNDVDDDDGDDDNNGTTSRRRSSTSYGKDGAFSPSSNDEDEEEEKEEEVYEEEDEEDEEEDDDDNNDPSFESPGKKKKQSSSTSNTTKKKGSRTVSAKKRKEKEKEELKQKMKLLQEDPTNICFRYCVDPPTQTARKPRWGVCDAAYKKYFDWNLYTSNKDPYTQVLNHFKKELDEDANCNTKLVEYNHAFFFYDPYTKSSPYNLDEDDYDWKSKTSSTAPISTAPISTTKELIKALVLSGNSVEVESDNNDANILDTGEGTNNSDDDNGDSNNTEGTSNGTSNGTSYSTSNADTRTDSNADTRTDLSNADTRTDSNADTRTNSSNADTRTNSSNADTRTNSSNADTRTDSNADTHTDSNADTHTGTKKKVIVLDIIVRAMNKKKSSISKNQTATTTKANKCPVTMIQFRIRQLANTDPSNDKVWVQKDIIRTMYRDYDTVTNKTLKWGELFATIKQVVIENNLNDNIRIGNKSCLFLTLNRRDRNVMVLKRIERTQDLISQLMSLAKNETNATMIVDIAIGEKKDGDTIMGDLNPNEEMLLSQQPHDDPKDKKMKPNSKDERQATYSHTTSDRKLVRFLCLDTKSPLQYCLSSEMEGIILCKMEVDRKFANDLQSAIFREVWDDLPSFEFINDNVMMKNHDITFDNTKKCYIPVPRPGGGDLDVPKAIKEHGNSKRGGGGGGRGGGAGGVATVLSDLLQSSLGQLTTAATSMQRKKKVTNITFLRDKDDGVIRKLSLMATEVEACDNGFAIINHCNTDGTDKEGVFTLSDSDKYAIFRDKTRTVRFEFVGLDTSLYLDQFKMTPTSDILMGINTTVQIQITIEDVPLPVAGESRIQF